MTDILNYDREYFFNIKSCKHYFGDQNVCQWCFSKNIDQVLYQNKTISKLYPKFDELNFVLNGMNKTSKIFKKPLVEISLDQNEPQSIGPISYMNPENNNCLKLKFIENGSKQVGIKLNLN